MSTSTINLEQTFAKKLGMRTTAIKLFQDLKNENEATLDFKDIECGKRININVKKKGLKWRQITRGINLFGKCTNEKCEAYKLEVIQMIKSPELYLSNPPMIFSKVVFPDPLEPKIDANSFLLNLILIPFSTSCRCSPTTYPFFIFFNSSIEFLLIIYLLYQRKRSISTSCELFFYFFVII